MEYLEEMKNCDDQLIATCSHFLEMSSDFMESVIECLVEDIITTIGYGYQNNTRLCVVGQDGCNKEVGNGERTGHPPWISSSKK